MFPAELADFGAQMGNGWGTGRSHAGGNATLGQWLAQGGELLGPGLGGVRWGRSRDRKCVTSFIYYKNKHIYLLRSAMAACSRAPVTKTQVFVPLASRTIELAGTDRVSNFCVTVGAGAKPRGLKCNVAVAVAIYPENADISSPGGE